MTKGLTRVSNKAGYTAGIQQLAGCFSVAMKPMMCLQVLAFVNACLVRKTKRALSIVQPKDICSRRQVLIGINQQLLLISSDLDQSAGFCVGTQVMLTIGHNPAATDICKMEHLTERHGPRLALCLQQQMTMSKACSCCCVSQAFVPHQKLPCDKNQHTATWDSMGI